MLIGLHRELYTLVVYILLILYAKKFSPNDKVGLNETVNNRLSSMIKTISLKAYR